MNQIKPLKKVLSCQLCNQAHAEGILIKGRSICASCEAKMVTTTPDHPAYEVLKDQIKAVLFQPAQEV